MCLKWLHKNITHIILSTFKQIKYGLIDFKVAIAYLFINQNSIQVFFLS